MTPALDAPIEASAARAGRAAGPRVTLRLLRAVALVHVALVVGQPLLAGMYLGGDFDALRTHATNANVVVLAALVQAGVALAYVWPGRGRLWPLPLSVGLFLAEGFQIGLGYERDLALHLPLGVTIVVAQVLFTIWVLRRSARTVRNPRRSRAH